MFRSLVALCIVTALAACESSSSDGDPKLAGGCSGFESVGKSWRGHDAVFTPTPGTNLSNGQRTYFWVADLANLCVAAPESGNFVIFEVDVEPGAPPLTVVGKVYAALGFQPYSVALTYEQYAPLTNGQYAYKGEVTNIGLAQGSTDGKSAIVSIQLSVTFPSKGSDDADLTYANSFIDNVELIWKFQTL